MEHWLEGVYREHAPALFRFLLRLTGHEADTRDVLQDIFVRLARSPEMLEGVAAPRSYLFRMAHRLVIDRHRREQVRQVTAEEAAKEIPLAADPETLGDEAAWRQKSVAASLEALPLEQKAVVVLKVWEEMTFAEIAAVLDLSPHTAASRYRYALDKLRDALRPLHEDHP
jgi:RNA polymerase sigma-70 factor (ECF subfamily)